MLGRGSFGSPAPFPVSPNKEVQLLYTAQIPATVHVQVEAENEEDAEARIMEILDDVHEDWGHVLAPGTGAGLTTDVSVMEIEEE